MLRSFYRTRLMYAAQLLNIDSSPESDLILNPRLCGEFGHRLQGFRLSDFPERVNFYLEADSLEQIETAGEFAMKLQRAYTKAYRHSALDLIWVVSGLACFWLGGRIADQESASWIMVVLLTVILVVSVLGLFEWWERQQSLKEFNQRLNEIRKAISVTLSTYVDQPLPNKIVLQYPIPSFL